MDSDLFLAATEGDVSAIENIFDRNRPENPQLSEGNHNILHLASQSGETQNVQHIVNNFGSLLGKRNNRGETELHLAARSGHAEVVDILIQAAIERERNPRTFLASDNDILNLESYMHLGNEDGNIALHLAVQNNHLPIVRRLVQTRVQLSSTLFQNSIGHTPVYAAAIGGYQDIINTILENCPDANMDGPDGKTALHAASERGHIGCVKIIVDGRRDMIRKADDKGWIALHYAASCGHDEVVRILIEAAKSQSQHFDLTSYIRSSNEDGNTALRLAIQNNHLPVISVLVEQDPYALHNAAKKGHDEVVRMLIEAAKSLSPPLDMKSFIRLPSRYGQNTALNLAVQNNHPNVVTMLVEQDAYHTHIKNSIQHTPVYAAAIRGYQDIITIIIAKCPFASMDGPDGKTALHAASERGGIGCVVNIIDSGTNKYYNLIRKADDKRWTPLHYAASCGHDKVVRKLIEAYKSQSPPLDLEYFIRFVNEDGNTALHLAVQNNRPPVVSVLVEQDPSDTHTKNSIQHTPVYAAAIGGYQDIITIILENCPDASMAGPDGKAAIHAATEKRHIGCVKFFVDWRSDMIRKADDKGWTAVHYAADRNVGLSILKILVKAEIDVANGEGTSVTTPIQVTTPLHIAASKGYVYIVKELMTSFPNSCDAVDEQGQNILHIAVAGGHKEVVKCILKNCPTVGNFLNRQDKSGYTPLHVAAVHGCFIPDLIKYEGVDKNAKDNEDFTPADLLYQNEEIVAEQLAIRVEFEDKQPKQRSWFTTSETADPPGSLVETRSRRSKDQKFKKAYEDASGKILKQLRARASMQMVVAALVASVTFSAGFALTGVYKNNGAAHPLQKPKGAVFGVFLFFDATALVCSILSLFLYFASSLYQDVSNASKFFSRAMGFNISSLCAMMITFTVGIFVLLPKGSSIYMRPTGPHPLIVSFELTVIALFVLLIVVIYYFRIFFPALRRIRKIPLQSLWKDSEVQLFD